ncbi:MAG: PVC-type heme-binding CxxCH protein [Gemmatimonadota bacterium]
MSPPVRALRALVPVLALVALASCQSAGSETVRVQPPAPVLTEMPSQRPAESGRVQVLFLGGDGHHVPEQRAKDARPILAYNGIDLFYTDDAADLNTAELAKYHALVFYNNQPRIEDDELAALTDFIENGGGLVVLHSASASFQNSEEFIRLVGAAFKSHGTGTFSVTRTQPNHAVVAGVPSFESWEETYVHTKHNPDRTVLEVRREGSHEEPWTWVRNYGDGRIFYTAWGHDQRTWGNDGFQQLLSRAIKWSAGDWALNQRLAEPNTPTAKLPAPLPVYERPPAPWNTLAALIDTAQVALDPADSYRLMTLPPGFRVDGYASEPLIRNIIDFAWDERGRMWVIETMDYPNVVLPEGTPGNDRVLILEDTNGDGRPDNAKVFADGLNLATSLAFANGGLVVGQAPDMLFFRDTNGDDVADEKKVLFTGWPRGDTHGTISNLRYGFDNHVWGSVGYNGFRGTVGGVEFGRGAISMGAGYYRFAADGSMLDYVARTNNNTWGVGFTEDGFVFGSTANRNASNFVHIPGRYYRELLGATNPQGTPTLPRIATREDVYPVRRILQVDQFDMYTAGSAHEIYTARAFPREYWNNVAFVAEPTAHLIGKLDLNPVGSGFVAKNTWTLMASRDEWQAPVQVKVGPDGAVWVSDFYSLVAQHNPTPEGFELGEGNAYETPNRDKIHGRIYRIYHEDEPQPQITRLDNATPALLVAALRNDNMFWRMTAQRLLVDRAQTDVVPALIELLNDHTIDGLGLNPGALHALWTLEGLGAIASNPQADAAARRALAHPAASLRRAALQVLPRNNRLLDDIFAAGMLPDRSSPHAVDYTVPSNVLQDADAHVRLQAILTVSELPASDRAAAALVELLSVPDNARDRWIPEAVAIAGVKQGTSVAISLLQRPIQGRMAQDSAYIGGLARALQMMTEHYAAAQNTAAVVALISALPQADQTLANSVLTGIAGGPMVEVPGRDGPRQVQQGGEGGWPEQSAPTLTAQQRAALVQAANAAAPELADGFARVAARWGMPDLFGSR